jgi:hypothetical protein
MSIHKMSNSQENNPKRLKIEHITPQEQEQQQQQQQLEHSSDSVPSCE